MTPLLRRAWPFSYKTSLADDYPKCCGYWMNPKPMDSNDFPKSYCKILILPVATQRLKNNAAFVMGLIEIKVHTAQDEL